MVHLMDFSCVCRKILCSFKLPSSFYKDIFLPKSISEVLFKDLSHIVKSSAVTLKTCPIMDKSLFIDKELCCPWVIGPAKYYLCISRDFCVFSTDWSLFPGKNIYSSFSDNYTYGICILIKKTVVMSDSYKQKFIIRTFLISLKCSLPFLQGS